jgi:deaminated glutathione amidase
MAPPPDKLSVAVTQPPLLEPGERNVEAAAELARRAAAAGAELVLLPEAFPGPRLVAESYDPAARLAALAAELGCLIAWGRIEARAGRWFVVHRVQGRAGETLARYERTHPATGDVNLAITGGAWISAGPELCVFDALGTRFGLLVCSELWQPEVARALALRGAEVILAPAGGGFTAVAANWELLARARAIENQCHLLLSHCRLGERDGSALIAGPEDLRARRPEEDLLLAELDLSRARWLREHDDSMAEPKPFRSLPGLLRARRPELYAELTAPREGLYDYEAPEAIRPARAGEREGVAR